MLPTMTTLSRSASIGWIGLGAMGHPMAYNLYTKAHEAFRRAQQGGTSEAAKDRPQLIICEPDTSRVDSFIAKVRSSSGEEAAARVRRVGYPSEVVKESGWVFTMLPSTPQVEAVYLGPHGVVEGIEAISSSASSSPLSKNPIPWVLSGLTSTDEPAHTILVDHTTLDPNAARRVAQVVHELSSRKALMLDGPVSGGIIAASDGKLTIMLGSPSPNATALVSPLLAYMAKPGSIIECGVNGAGVGVKVCNNLVLAINQIALAEGLALGRSLDIDPVLLHNVINSSSGQSWSSKVNSPLHEVSNSPGSRDYTGGFQSRLMLKDVGLALHAAHAHSLPTPLTWAARSVYDAVCAEGEGDWASKDFSVVYEWIKKKQAEGVEKGWKEGGPGA